jgi:hypothetical protein
VTVIPFSREKPYTPTFVCIDCKAKVYDALDQVRERCLTCQWLADIEDPVERETLRRWYRELK